MVQGYSKDCTVNHPPKLVKIRVLFLSWNLRFSMAQLSLIGLYAFSSTYIPSFKTHSVHLHKSKALFDSQSTAGAKWLFCSQKSEFLVNILFWVHNHHLIKSWSWFHKNSSKVIKMQKVTIWTVEKSTVSWPGHNFFMVHHKNSIQCSFWRRCDFIQSIFTFQVQ